MVAKPSVWWRAARPFTLSASAVPVLVGSALAFRDGQGSLPRLLLTLLGSLLVQAGVNFVDESSDHGRVASAHKHPAPYKVIARGELTAGAVRKGAFAVFGLAALVGIYFAAVVGLWILAVCLASLGAAYFYAGGRKPLGHAGLGWPLVFLFMGIVLTATSYAVHTLRLPPSALGLSLPVACMVTAILVANDLRDREEDLAEGKRTPVTALGRGAGKAAWLVFVSAAYLLAVLWGELQGARGSVLWVFLSVPWALRAGLRIVKGNERATLAPALPETGLLHLVFGILLAAGIFMGR